LPEPAEVLDKASAVSYPEIIGAPAANPNERSFEQFDAAVRRGNIVSTKILPRSRGINRNAVVRFSIDNDDGSPGQVKVIHRTVEERRGRDAPRDSNRHELAAYRIARSFSLDNIPHTKLVNLGRFRGERLGLGTSQLWLTGVVDAESVWQDVDLSADEDLRLKVAGMRLFDCLIGNADRNLRNFLIENYGEADVRLWWIDHTAAFETRPLGAPHELFENKWSCQEVVAEPDIRSIDQIEKIAPGICSIANSNSGDLQGGLFTEGSHGSLLEKEQIDSLLARARQIHDVVTSNFTDDECNFRE